MGISATLRRILRRNKAVGGPAAPDSKAKSLDTALIIEAARFVVTTRLASKTVLMRHLAVTSNVADIEDALAGFSTHLKAVPTDS